LISYWIYRKIGTTLIKKNLKEIQRNDCFAFDEEEIGKEKYFNRKFFIKRDRDANMNAFEFALEETKKILNKKGDIEYEEGKN